jgi:hypothetical protein
MAYRFMSVSCSAPIDADDFSAQGHVIWRASDTRAFGTRRWKPNLDVITRSFSAGASLSDSAFYNDEDKMSNMDPLIASRILSAPTSFPPELVAGAERSMRRKLRRKKISVEKQAELQGWFRAN